MITTYFLRERRSPADLAESTILRIIDRNTILTSTAFGVVYINRQCAARILREYRRRVANPFCWNGEQKQFMEYEKNVTT